MSGNIAYDGGGDQNLLKLAAARVIACEKMPYFAQALFAMVPVKVPNLIEQYAAEQRRLGSNGQMLGFAADAKWRFYWDPAAVERYPVEQIAGVLLHEVGHLIRHHADRFAAMNEPARNHSAFNIAGDSLINGDLRDERIPLPDGCVYIEQLEGATREMSAEQIFYLLRKLQEDKCTCGKGQQDKQDKQPSSGGKDKQEGKDKGDEQGGEQGSDPGKGDSDNPQNGDGDSDEQGNGDGKEQGDGGNGDSDSDEQGNGEGEGEGQGGNGQPDPNCPVHGNRKCNGNHSSDGSGDPCDGSCDHSGGNQSWDCGSSSDGVKRDYEKEGDKIDPGVDEERADLIRQQTAVEIKNHVKNRGTVPAGLERWAKELLEPVIDWRRELASIVRRTYASVAGRKDYSYSRPSRRQAAMRSSGQNIILPAMRQPSPPIVGLVMDTSGSMSDDDLTWSLSEVQGVLRSIGGGSRTTRVFTCDAQVDEGKRVSNVSQVKMQGGGGTDMRVGIAAAMASHPKPDVVIVLSDGGTPWPTEPLKGATLIIGLTDETTRSNCPEWARVVLISQDVPTVGKR